MNKSSYIFLLSVVLLTAIVLASCTGAGSPTEPTMAGISISQLREEGRSPVIVSPITLMASPTPVKQFEITVENISSARIELINGFTIFFDKDDEVITDLLGDTGSAEAVAAAQTIKMRMSVNHEAATSGVWIIRRLTYRVTDRSGKTFLMIWNNPDYADQLRSYLGDDAQAFLEEQDEA